MALSVEWDMVQEQVEDLIGQAELMDLAGVEDLEEDFGDDLKNL